MTYVTDKCQLCFCLALAALNSYILFLHSQHSWHLCRQLATYALSCLCILVSKSAWRRRYRYTCNWTKTIEEHIIVFCTWYLRNCTWCQQSSYPCSGAWASEGVFFRVEGALTNFSTGNHKKISRGANSDEISFFLLETKKTTIFAKNVIKMSNFKIQGERLPCPCFRHPSSKGEFTVLYDFHRCTWHRAVASGGPVVPGLRFKICAPISFLEPWLLHTSNIVFKNVATLVVLGHPCCEILATGLTWQYQCQCYSRAVIFVPSTAEELLDKQT